MARAAGEKRMFLPSFLPSRTTMLLTGLAIGILFAPRSGQTTRSLIIRKYLHWINQIGGLFEGMARWARYQSGRWQGAVHETKEAIAQNEKGLNDQALPQRIKSELGRFFNVSDIDVSSRGGIVTLRGGVANDQERQNIIEMTKKIEGVRDVVNMLR
jgi:gas vesicle protein